MATLNSLTQIPNLTTLEQVTLWAATVLFDNDSTKINFDIYDSTGVLLTNQAVPANRIEIVSDRSGTEYARCILHIPLASNHRTQTTLFWEKAVALPDLPNTIPSLYLRQP